eukprot:CAMPEP_0185583842 /NCGR_PEP_ID=MMETSP0434-20130131/28129_1 /TAXON_ID=626734 ORGANISM="Favella taraikaensis, Strain Fe Narragansett Bay" /NCGR_SAMPLE_ID=MMETSP0434 /ASSEMBLY_ACC=CAM_ASM_000379 /LENGTH=139 /DNA_ID=CAMNT_0028203223 /DNA_START=969 /DNA_END=1389 /DNA_ORIENTATION=+
MRRGQKRDRLLRILLYFLCKNQDLEGDLPPDLEANYRGEARAVLLLSADKDIFLTNETQSNSSSSNYSYKFSSATHESESSDHASENSQKANGPTVNGEEEVFLMNIDYFEQWDRIYQLYGANEKEVLHAMKLHNIKMI